MNCCENLGTPLDDLHIKTRTKSKDVFRAGMFGLNTIFRNADLKSTSVYQLFVQYCGCVEDYSRRELTYEKDALNAFMGIMQRFESIMVNSFVGVSSFARVNGLAYPVGIHERLCNLLFTISLSWRHHGSTSVKRRPKFPSWTWAGWSGGVHFATLRQSALWPPNQNRALNFAFEDESGTRSKLSARAHKDRPSNLADVFLCLKAVPVPVGSFFYNSNPKSGLRSGPFEGNAGTSGSWKLFKYDAHLYLSDNCIPDLQLSE